MRLQKKGLYHLATANIYLVRACTRILRIMMKDILTLWDIDGNLVNVYKFHTPSYQKAFEEVFGVKLSFPEIEKNYGLPSWDVISLPLIEHGIPKELIGKNMDRTLSIYALQLEKGISKASEEVVLPGVLKLLGKLSSFGVPMGIVTGNIKRSAGVILKSAGLGSYFDSRISGYGDMPVSRSEIVACAILSARKVGMISKDARIFVFGDTPSDVSAAKENGCISVAVVKNSNEPGSSPGGKAYSERKKLLEAAYPDHLLDDYTGTKKVLDILGL